MLLWKASLRSCGRAVPPDELPLLHLPAHDWCALCRLVQRTTLGVSRRGGRTGELPLEQVRDPDLCTSCSTQLTFTSDDYPDEIDVTTCSLDDPEVLPPHDHTRTSSKLRWIRLADGLPEYREERPVE
jgi:hypothetical protein